MTPILHSVSYGGVWPGQAKLSLPQFLDKARELEFPAVMLMAKRPHLSVLDYPSDACKRLRAGIEARGLKVAVIAGYNNFSADLEREIQIQHITELARMAADLGAGVVRIFTAFEVPGVSYTELWQAVVEAIRECARRASGYGVVIGVQNHHDMAGHHESLLDLIETINEPNCKAIFDAWAPALQGVDLVAAAAKLAPVTCHTTAADYQLRPRFHYRPNLVNYEAQTAWTQAVPMGEGFIDYRGFFRALVDHGYQGGVAYEMCSPLRGGGAIGNLDGYARRFLDFLR